MKRCVPPFPCIIGGEYVFCWTIVLCGVRGFDVKESGVNRNRWLNGAVCACWAGCAVLVEYGDLAYRGICLR